MKKLFAIAIVSAALAACGGKSKPADETMGNTGGDTGTTTTDTGGAAYGGDTYGNPCAGGNPCGTATP
jgi:hypothetical protein